MAKLGILAVYGTVLQAFFRPLALVTYARYDPAVKDKHLLHDLTRMVHNKNSSDLDMGRRPKLKSDEFLL